MVWGLTWRRDAWEALHHLFMVDLSASHWQETWSCWGWSPSPSYHHSDWQTLMWISCCQCPWPSCKQITKSIGWTCLCWCHLVLVGNIQQGLTVYHSTGKPLDIAIYCCTNYSSPLLSSWAWFCKKSTHTGSFDPRCSKATQHTFTFQHTFMSWHTLTFQCNHMLWAKIEDHIILGDCNHGKEGWNEPEWLPKNTRWTWKAYCTGCQCFPTKAQDNSDTGLYATASTLTGPEKGKYNLGGFRGKSGYVVRCISSFELYLPIFQI